MEYNLCTQPWIRCLCASGEVRELNLEEVLLEDSVVELCNDHPVVDISLYRLLIAIVSASSRPTPVFDRELISAYLKKNRKKFDLFDKKRPFLQHPDLGGVTGASEQPPSYIADWTKSAGNNGTLFSKSIDRTSSLSIPEAARWMIANLSFTNRANPGAGWRPVFAPLSGVAVFLVAGKSLHEIIEVNLPKSIPSQDRLPWEHDLELPGSKRKFTGPLDSLVGKSRSILLGESAGKIESVTLCSGVDVEDFIDYSVVPIDIVAKKKKLVSTFKYRMTRSGGGFPHSIFNSTPAISRLPELIARFPKADEVWSYGAVTDKALMLYFTHDRIKIPGPHILAQFDDIKLVANTAASRIWGMSKFLDKRNPGNAQSMFLANFWAEITMATKFPVDDFIKQVLPGCLERSFRTVMPCKSEYISELIRKTLHPEDQSVSPTAPEPQTGSVESIAKKLRVSKMMAEAIKMLGWDVTKSRDDIRSVLNRKLPKNKLSPNQTFLIKKAKQVSIVGGDLDSNVWLRNAGENPGWVEESFIKLIQQSRPASNGHAIFEQLAKMEGGDRLLLELAKGDKQEVVARATQAVKMLPGKATSLSDLFQALSDFESDMDVTRLKWVNKFLSAKENK